MRHNNDFNELVSLLNIGDNNGKLCCIAGRPAMGKSALMISFALHCVQDKIPTAIFSLEMPNVKIVRRLISSYSDLSTDKISLGELTKEECEDLEKMWKNLSDFPLFIDDTPGITIDEIKKKVRTLKEQRNIQVVIIDYLQLINTDEIWTSRKDEVYYILRELKHLSEDCQISIVILSQLSKLLQTVPPHFYNCWRQSLSKEYMRHSVDDAPVVCNTDYIDFLAFIHRPFYYQRKNLPEQKNKFVEEPIMIIIENDQSGTQEEYEFTFNNTTGSIY